LCLAMASPAQLSREEDLKAALLLSFLRFTEWPRSVGSEVPIVIGILGQTELYTSISRIAFGKSVQGRPIQVRGIRHPGDQKLCQVVYLGSLSGSKLEEHLAVAREASILTIGEDDRFHQSGGIIQLFVEDGRLSFSVHLSKLASTKLNISSKLLRLGYTVKDQSNGTAVRRSRP
jgi:hypothetical protein